MEGDSMADTPTTEYENAVDLTLGNVPQDITDPEVYEALLIIHNAIEALAEGSITIIGGILDDFITKFRATIVADADYAPTILDGTIFIDASANNVTVTLPIASEVPGYRYDIKVIDDTNVAAVVPTAGDLLDTEAADFEMILHETITVKSDGTDWWII